MLQKLFQRDQLGLHLLMGVMALSVLVSVMIQDHFSIRIIQLTQAMVAWVMLFGYGRPFMKEAIAMVRKQELSRSVLITLSVGAALLWSTWSVCTSDATYFVTAGFTLYFVLVGLRLVVPAPPFQAFELRFLQTAIGLAFATFVIWAFLIGSVGEAGRYAVAVLIASCPATITLIRSRTERRLSYFYTGVAMLVAMLGLFQPLVASFFLILIVLTISVHRFWSRDLLS